MKLHRMRGFTVACASRLRWAGLAASQAEGHSQGLLGCSVHKLLPSAGEMRFFHTPLHKPPRTTSQIEVVSPNRRVCLPGQWPPRPPVLTGSERLHGPTYTVLSLVLPSLGLPLKTCLGISGLLKGSHGDKPRGSDGVSSPQSQCHPSIAQRQEVAGSCEGCGEEGSTPRKEPLSRGRH